MNCLLQLLAVCMLDPGNVYITAGLETQIARPQNEGRWCATRWCSGPMGMMRLGVKVDVTSNLQLDYGLLHTSFVNTTRDRGVESAYFNLTWRPFR